jgi:rare lipoprotein A
MAAAARCDLGGLFWLALALVLGACATGSTPSGGAPVAPPPPRGPIAAKVGATESGEASWYGAAHQGRPTSSGEAFDMSKLTAAHPTLPAGTQLRVTNLRNGRSVQVRVNDRGPAVPGRIIDLSHAAAEALGFLDAGVAPVRIQVLSLPR